MLGFALLLLVSCGDNCRRELDEYCLGPCPTLSEKLEAMEGREFRTGLTHYYEVCDADDAIILRQLGPLVGRVEWYDRASGELRGVTTSVDELTCPLETWGEELPDCLDGCVDRVLECGASCDPDDAVDFCAR